MTIQLINMTQEKNKVTKTVSAGISITGTLRDGTDVINPSIMVEKTVDSICGYNYAYIPAFKRYYFINNVSSFRNSLSVISMTVDVLKSYESTILNSKAIITRSSKAGDPIFSLPDERLPVKQSDTTHIYAYPELYSNTDPLKAQSLILVLTGINPA